MTMHPYKHPDKIPIGARVNKGVWLIFKEICKKLKVNAGDVLDDLMEEWANDMKETIQKMEEKNFNQRL